MRSIVVMYERFLIWFLIRKWFLIWTGWQNIISIYSCKKELELVLPSSPLKCWNTRNKFDYWSPVIGHQIVQIWIQYIIGSGELGSRFCNLQVLTPGAKYIPWLKDNQSRFFEGSHCWRVEENSARNHW